MKKLIVCLSAVLLSAVVYAGEIPEITVPQLEKAITDKQVVLLDANGLESYQKGHIPGAIDFKDLKGDLASVLPKDKNALIVAYCGGPACKAYKAAAEAATKLGYTNVKHLTAGITGWVKAGAKTEKVDKSS